ncbi:hypothetical protein LSH36_337g01034 [Paralvinella palmiformis]|uniref:G-protein coupled receptors family 1 profile domain-containing protein n=1 Tax=Paralvinella palmiformis TaxID=53620 RepID=A0AAD9JGV7_9ANNE|nr:hypothetical protein LSH36_337g01034 [Paralvinella palmiformis]
MDATSAYSGPLTTEQQQQLLQHQVVRLTTIPVMRYISFAIGSLGLVGNTFVVAVILGDGAMRRQLTNAYITNQSLLDATVSALLVLTTALEDDGRRFDFDAIADQLFCKLWLTKVWLWAMFVSSTYNLLAMTTERYLAVVHPIWHRGKLTKGKVVGSLAAVWLFGPVYNLAYMVPTSGPTREGGCTVYSLWPNGPWRNAVGVLTICIQFVLPLVLLTFFYVRMIVVLRRRVRPEPGGGGGAAPAGGAPLTRAPGSMARAQANIFKTLLIVSFCFIFCWSWNQIFFLLFNLGYDDIDLTSAFSNFSVVMVFMNCCINPFVYISKYEQFKKTTKRLFACKNNAELRELQTQESSLD